MNIDERKSNLDTLVKHFKKFPEILKLIQSSPEDMEWISGCDDMDCAVEEVKTGMEEKPAIKSVEDLRNAAKEKE